MRRVVPLALAALLLTAPPALAKGELEAGQVVICGPSGCGPFDDTGSLRWLTGLMYAENPIERQAAPVSSYYELRWTGPQVEPGARPIAWVAPDAGAIASSRFIGNSAVRWFPLAGGVAGAVDTAAGDLEPFPAPTLTRVYVGDNEAPETAPYTALLGPLQPRADTPTADLVIGLVTAGPTPWTMPSSYAELDYSTEADAVAFDGTWYEAPAGLAERIERDAGLQQPEASPAAPAAQPEPAAVVANDDDDGPWSLVAALTIGAVALGVALALLRRRAPGHVPRGA
jgi:hypothetical protein